MQSWRELGERVVYKGFRSIRKRKFELPNGEVAEFELLELFDSVAVLALTAAHEVILVREFRPGPMAVLLELPGGVVEIGQAPVEAAASELLEETGYAGTLQEVGTLFKDAYAANTKHVFAATDCQRVAEPELPAFTVPVLLSLADFREHLQSGQLTDTDAAYRALDVLGLVAWRQ